MSKYMSRKARAWTVPKGVSEKAAQRPASWQRCVSAGGAIEPQRKKRPQKVEAARKNRNKEILLILFLAKTI